jgi:chromate transporter
VFLSCLRIGATGFGGPMALISLLQEEFVERRKAVTPEVFAEGVAIGGILPGPIAIDAAVHLGYRLRGWLGALSAAAGLIAPPFVLMLALAPLYLRVGRLTGVEGFLVGVRPAVVAVIAAAAWRLGKRGVTDLAGFTIAAFVLVASVVGARIDELAPGSAWLVRAAPTIKTLGSVVLILLSGVLGMVFLGRPKPAQAKETQP